MLMNLAVLAIFWVAAILIEQGSLPVGQLVAFMDYLFHAMFSVMLFCTVFMQYPRAEVSAKRIEEVLNTKPLVENPKNGVKEGNHEGTLEFDHVTFVYPDGEEAILKDISFRAKKGETIAFIGSTGSGKSTLSSVLVGNPAFEVTEGEVIFNGKNLLDLEPEDRSREGIFLSFQYPVEIPGVSMVNFMRAALNEHRKYKGLEPVSATDFLKLMREKRAIVELDNKLASRSVNEGFSGGEKKRNEIFQMAMLEPKLAILDETDSGLDIDALRIVANGVNQLRTPENAAIVITHYQRLLDYIKPDVVHVLYKGRIVKTAGPELALELEEKGYDWIKKEMGEE